MSSTLHHPLNEDSPLLREHGTIAERCWRVMGRFTDGGSFQITRITLWHYGSCNHGGVIAETEAASRIADAFHQYTSNWAI